MTRTDDEIRAIVKASVEETLLALGIDTDEPLEAQKDFQHLRAWRTSSETVKRQGLMTAVGILITGLLGLIYLAVRGGP
ncbi:hypothetical protein [Kaistia terrae]|uniref:DUF3618 domain-containing protein n=1 Tax=Kaistia terrae TaxID=537017 RepID=A0ABW0Q2M5_9HYPH|nr:hypothetical protein [Kaistia terrae]MCX5581502.1 hypothetical protein [Kaistia terrae]